MTVFNPVWRVTIGGVQYQTAILANLTIQSGRTNIYEQAQAGYTNLEIINLDSIQCCN
jgi:tRNA A37 N6-isopentenylltransferase MiaA